MRVIFANNYYYLRGGADRVFFDEIKLLETNGYQVSHFSRHFEKNYSSEYSRYFPPNFEYLNAIGIDKISAALKLIYSIECRKYFGNLLEIFKPDIVHAHNIYGRLTTSILDEGNRRKVPVVMTLHDYKLICPSYLLFHNGCVCERCKGKRFYHCVIQRCHKKSITASIVYTVESYFNKIFDKDKTVRYFICPSRFLREKHLQAGISEKRLIYVPNFIEPKNFTPDYTHDNYILYCGRLSREKGVLTLLKATKSLDIILRIVGDGPMRDEYERFVRENRMNNVVFEGYKSGDELKNLWKRAVFIVFPSEMYENAPMSILESFAYGKPVIGSNIGGIPEMIIDGETGLLFTPGDSEELRGKIGYLLSNPSIITEMGKKAREKVEKEYNPEIHYQNLMEVYKRALSS